MGYHIDLGQWNSIFAVPCAVADRHLKLASEAQLKVLLYLLRHAGEDCALVTIQNHLNTIAVCTLVGCAVIVLCHARPVPPDMAEAAAREGVAIVVTPLSQYAAARALSALPPAEH